MKFSSVLAIFFLFFYLGSHVTLSQPLSAFSTLPTIVVPAGDNWVTGLTANINVPNPLGSQVRSMIITLKICHGSITSVWNALPGTFTSHKTYSTSNYEVWQFQLEALTVSAGGSYNGIGFVLSNTADFDVRRDLLLGADIFTTPTLDCDGLGCSLYCGDGLCSYKENSTGLCPIDCVPNQCYIPTVAPALGNTWKGVGSYVLSSPIYSWTSWVGGNIYVQNPSASNTAVSYIMTIKYCTQRMILTALWGYDQQMVSYSNQYTVYRQVAKNLALAPSGNYNMAGMNFMIYSGADFNTQLAIRVDLYDYNIACSVGDCVVTCGNGVCDAGENSSNCAIDCVNLSC